MQVIRFILPVGISTENCLTLDFFPEIIISMASVQVNLLFCLPAVIAEILITLCFFYFTQLYYPKFYFVEMNSFDYVWSKFVKSL